MPAAKPARRRQPPAPEPEPAAAALAARLARAVADSPTALPEVAAWFARMATAAEATVAAAAKGGRQKPTGGPTCR